MAANVFGRMFLLVTGNADHLHIGLALIPKALISQVMKVDLSLARSALLAAPPSLGYYPRSERSPLFGFQVSAVVGARFRLGWPILYLWGIPGRVEK